MAKPECICDCARSTLLICRLFGLLPIRWAHQNGKCIFETSKFWIGYSLVFSAVNIFHFIKIYGITVIPFQQDRALLLDYITSVNECIITFFTTLLIFVNIYRAPKIVAVLNRFVELTANDLQCKNSIKMNHMMHTMFAVTMFLQYLMQFATIFAFKFIRTFEADWTYSRFIMPVIHNTTFLFYSLFGSACVFSASLLYCFENKIKSILNFTSVHPVPDFCSTKVRTVLCWKYVTCKYKHSKCSPNLDSVEKLEYLQSLYVDIQNYFEALNASFNPQLFLHISNEVIVLIFHWYAVIVYFTYAKVTGTDNTNNFFHWYYIIVHSWAMYMAMTLAQEIEEKVQRYKVILLEHATVVSNQEEHQQLRIFVQMLDNFKGFSASGIFNLNLQISAPVCANILMYVLVAIQFQFPKKDT